MRTIVCLALLAVITLLGLPLLHEVLAQFGWFRSYDGPMEVVSTLADQARKIGDMPKIEYAFAFLGGMIFATLIDAFLERIERRQSKNYALLGDKAVRLGLTIQAELESATRRRDHPPPSLLAEVNALMVELKEVGIPVPVPPKGTEVDKWIEMAGVYCSHVGELLRNAHVRKAKRIAGPVQERLESN
jgi:hypothetical protein